MATPFNHSMPRGAINDFSFQFSDSIYDATITTAGGAKSLTVPNTSDLGLGGSPSSTNRYLAVFFVEYDKTVTVAKGATALINGTFTFGATSSKLIKSGDCRQVNAGDVLSFLTSDTAAYVSVEFYSIP